MLQTATLSATGGVTFSGTTTSIGIGNSATTGVITIGGTTQTTGNIVLGQSTRTSNIEIGNGAVASGNTKVINIGQGGLAGSTTTINIGPVTATTASATATFNTATTVSIANTGGAALSVVGNITGGNISAVANVQGGNLILSGSTGTLSGTGNIIAGNLSTTGSISAANAIISGNIFSAAWTTTGVGIRTVAATYFDTSTANAGTSATNHVHVLATPSLSSTLGVTTVTTAATLYIASAPTAGANVTLTNPYALIVAAGNVSMAGNVQTGNISTAGNINAANLILTGTAAAGSGVLIVSGNIQTSTANATANIGNASNYFNRLFAQATTALYADLAEMYVADAKYEPGTVLVFGGNQEVTISTITHDNRVAGVVSTNPAHIMNSGLQGEHTVEVALVGRVPVSVIGNITAGDRVVTSNRAGVAEALDMTRYQPGVIIGKALQSYSGNGVGVIEVVVGRL